MQEHVILLDEHGSPIGMEEKYTAHHHNTPLHLAFFLAFQFTRRMSGDPPGHEQKAWPGVWTNSVCGHPQEGETPEQAMVRRCRYEIGADIIDITSIAPGFATAKPIHPGLSKTKFARSSPHKSSRH
jgi:isopentenyl-diphosphate delta-isomerase